MTNSTHNTAVQMDVFPSEFFPVLNLVKRAICNDDVMRNFTEEEASVIALWLDAFQDLALEYTV